MYDNTTVEAKVQGVDAKQEYIFVNNLTTSLGIVSAAMLRKNDILSIECVKNK